MGFFSFMKSSDINEGVKRFHETKNAVLLDVRSRQEYAAGHIPGSRNLPLDQLDAAEDAIPDLHTPIFVHCLSGGRSARALAILKEMGYHEVSNIGGIGSYRGKLEAGI